MKAKTRLVAGEAKDDEPLVLVLVVQALQALVLWCEPTRSQATL